MNVFKLSKLEAEFATLKWFINSNREKDRGRKLHPHYPLQHPWCGKYVYATFCVFVWRGIAFMLATVCQCGA
jgi:hypothetical protein